MQNVLSAIRQVLQREKDLLGDRLLTEHGTRVRSASTPAAPAVPVAPAPSIMKAEKKQESLFEMPVHTPPVSAEAWSAATSLGDLNSQICNCIKCPLGHTRTHFVFGVGNPRATFMLIGEAPGADEDAQGEPFVGKAGQLLTKILSAIGFARSDVYICNILKCRPPNNRKPLPAEVEHCIPYLKKQIALIQPRVILCLGLTAAENLLQTKESLGKLRGRELSYEGIPLLVTYHPAALLRNPNWKQPAWEDVQAARRLHDERAHNS